MSNVPVFIIVYFFFAWKWILVRCDFGLFVLALLRDVPRHAKLLLISFMYSFCYPEYFIDASCVKWLYCNLSRAAWGVHCFSMWIPARSAAHTFSNIPQSDHLQSLSLFSHSEIKKLSTTRKGSLVCPCRRTHFGSLLPFQQRSNHIRTACRRAESFPNLKSSPGDWLHEGNQPPTPFMLMPTLKKVSDVFILN